MSSQSMFKAPEVDRSSGQMFALTALRMAIGWHLLYEGIAKMLQGNWSSASYLSSSTWIFAKFFRLIAEAPWALKTVDIINMWALAILGICLVLGFLTRSTAICSAGLLMIYYLAHPPFMAGGDPLAGPGSYLIIDHNLVESAALVVLALVRPGSLYGLDRLLFNRRRLQLRRLRMESSRLIDGMS